MMCKQISVRIEGDEVEISQNDPEGKYDLTIYGLDVAIVDLRDALKFLEREKAKRTATK
jgi:hypothetical protein